MRDAINPSEFDRLVGATRRGQSWEEVRVMLVGVDPAALDRNFREMVLSAAGRLVEAPPVEAPPVEEPPKAKRGKG